MASLIYWTAMPVFLRRPRACILACLLLGGCAHAPSTPPQTTIALPPSDGTIDGTLPAQWWRLYREPDLDTLVSDALANNRDLRVAVANLLNARAELGETRAKRGPSTGLSAGAGYGSTLQDQIAAASDGSDLIRTGSRFDAGTELSWELDLFGRLKSGVAAATADFAATAADADGIRVLIAARVTGAWLRACGIAHQTALAQETLALAERNRDIARTLQAAGTNSPTDRLQAEARVAETAAEIPALAADRHAALTELAILTGQPPSQIPASAAACTRIPVLDGPLSAGDAASLLRRRPDVRAAEQRLAAATARIGIAVGDLYPHVSLGGGLGLSSPSASGLTSRDNAVWRVGPLLSWSFPNLSAARARIAGARAEEAAALARFDAAILAALGEVDRAAQDYRTALERQAQLQVAQKRSGRIVAMTRARRTVGAATALDMLDSERADLSARAALAQADADLAAAQVHFFAALGGGWEEAPAVPLPAAEKSPPTSRNAATDAINNATNNATSNRAFAK
ncbi:TolC family protein [Novosphingobium sp. BL-8H]|uniref:TolC family protein n=1 Tax=Novosphingobium sp. BL-8H TaxID=3127640 RepID=UPI003757A7AE